MSENEKKLFFNIKKILQNKKLKELKKINLSLTKNYKSRKLRNFTSDDQRLSYITSRMPATFNSIVYVFKELIQTVEFMPKTFLDLGAGPATSLWALQEVFSDIKDVRLIEKDQNILFFGKQLLANQKLLKKVNFEKSNILKVKNYDYDLVLLSYVVNELKNVYIEKIIKRWFFSKSKILVLIEPGTMYGFEKIKFIRKKLMELQVNIAAPCPNILKCPMPKNDWCHFYVRVKRTKQHKYLKNATLPYEDEKFSYLIATKENVKNYNSRILRRPKRKKNEILLTLCKNGEIQNLIVSRKEKNKFLDLKDKNWGDKANV